MSKRKGSVDSSPRETGALALPAARLRWRCDPRRVGFATTSDITPVTGVVGQDSAIEALRFGLRIDGPGQNIFVRGLPGTGRATLVSQLLEEASKLPPALRDRCYVHDFRQPERPRLIELPPGKGCVFKKKMDRFAGFVRSELNKALDSEEVRERLAELERRARERIEFETQAAEATLRQSGMAVMTHRVGPVAWPIVVPVGAAAPAPTGVGFLSSPEQLRMRHARSTARGPLDELTRRVDAIRGEHQELVRKLYRSHAGALLIAIVRDIRRALPFPDVKRFLHQVTEDILDNRLERPGEPTDFTDLYRVNLLRGHEEDGGSRPVVVETTPTVRNLLGGFESSADPEAGARASHLAIHPGSILRADGGYLVLEARDVLIEPGTWRILERTLKTGRLSIVTPETESPWPPFPAAPEPIEVRAKVILLGDDETFFHLDRNDPEFRHLFKLLVDFEPDLPRNSESIGHYAAVLARIAREEQLPPFDRTAVASLVEHGARIATRAGRLTARFGRLADLAREAAFLATVEGRSPVTGGDVEQAVRRTKARSGLPHRQFRQQVADGRLRIRTRGRVIGQVNGLSVLSAGFFTYGFPARITATIGPGTAGLTNIEREAELSGSIHTKGFYILGGVLRTLLVIGHPLTFNASIAFEQSYGGIDGDSASGAEVCCLLSALARVPLRQDLAMTGAVDQRGHILLVGGVNEKIEGFFDVCSDRGLTGTQGVIIPAANESDLMLRREAVDAAAAGRFHVYSVSTVLEALELLTGRPAGEPDRDGRYPEGSLLAIASANAIRLWEQSAPQRDAPSFVDHP
jgi:ATP-dependent Lon protease